MQNEIFLYDRKVISSPVTEDQSLLAPKTVQPIIQTPRKPPDSLSNGNSLQSWQTLFRERKDWAVEVTEISLKLVEQIQKLERETNVVQRSAAIAVENIKQHVGNLRPKFESSKAWADGVLKDQSFLLSNWRPMLSKFSSLPVFEELGRCLQGSQLDLGRDAVNDRQDAEISLLHIVDVIETEKLSTLGDSISQHFRDRVTNLNATFDDVKNGSEEVIENFSQSVALSDTDPIEQASRLMEEIKVVARKVNVDYEYVHGLENSQKTISQVSRMALLHTRNFLPTLLRTNSEISLRLREIVERKDNAIQSAIQYMQIISVLESKVARIHAQLGSLDTEISDGQVFDQLSFLTRLPAVYGSLLIECVRRREWNEKITVDASSVVEEVATFKDEELRRRRKWIKDMGGAVDLASIDDMLLGVEVNIQAEKQRWPNISRHDVKRFLKSLKDLGSFEDIHQELEDLARNLDAPTKSQTRRAKAFKNGSIYDTTTFGKNSLLLRGDDDLLQSMKSEKSRLEERLKSSESRIRKLEDLLHRQSQLPRPSTGHLFGINPGPALERHATSPLINHIPSSSKPYDVPSRRSSVSSRRVSVNNETDEKSLFQRIISLETELGVEKEQVINLQKDAEGRTIAHNDLKLQIQAAVSTKDDLMENMEARQREFDAERRSLESENAKLKLKMEEVEDELDRVLENHDHENKILTLEKQLESVRREAAEQAQKVLAEKNLLQNDLTMQSERAQDLESKIREQDKEKAVFLSKQNELSTQLHDYHQTQAEHRVSLQAALLQLSKDDSPPTDFSSLVELIETLAEKSASHLNTIQETLETVRAENLAFETQAIERSNEIHDLKERLGTEEIEVFSVRESLAQHKAASSALQADLNHQRNEYIELQSKLSAEEYNSASLQAQLKEKQKESSNLMSEIVEFTNRIHLLERVADERQAKIADMEIDRKALDGHNEARSSRAEEVSLRLHSQNVTLGQLLEQIGLTIVEQDDMMVIQKVPKATSTSMALSDPSMSINRSSSGPSPAKSIFETFADNPALRWAKASNPDIEESRFSEYIRSIKKFDLDAFNEAVVKRVKEVEHTARKWQREARAYREKSHRAQSEAHEKIAFRSFKEGDLALFLPTRNQATRPWAAFNVGAPHFFLREQDSHKLRTRDWLLARISRVEERVVDLSKSIHGLGSASDRGSIGDASDGGASFDDENPFELSDGLRWYLLDAAEEKPGAPINVGLGKVTVASANVDAKGSIRMKKSLDGNGATKTLTRSLDSRRSSSNSKKGLVTPATGVPVITVEPEEPFVIESTNTSRNARTLPISSTEAESIGLPVQPADGVRNQDLLWGP